MLTLHLTPIFQARGIDKPFTYLVKAGLTPHSAHIILNSKSRVFRLDHIELLCRVLVCEPSDLLKFTPDKGQTYPDNHPLHKLKQEDTANHWQETFATMPLQQLRQVTKDILEKK